MNKASTRLRRPWPAGIQPTTREEATELAGLFSPQALETMQRIEKVEYSWRRENVSFPPSYGRESPDEPVLPWSVPRSTGWLLLSLVLTARPRVILELGTSLGYSTLWLAHAAEEVGAKVHTVESMPEKAREARQNLTDALFTSWELHECDAHAVCAKWNQPIDFLFLDADAMSYVDYWRLLSPHLSSRALIVADNALTHPHLLQPFIGMVSAHDAYRCFTHPMDNGLFIAAKLDSDTLRQQSGNS